MIKRIFITIALLYSLCSFSQETEVKIDQLESIEKGKQGTLLFAKQDVDGDIYVVSRTNGRSRLGYNIRHYSQDAKFLKEAFIEIRKSEVIGLVISHDAINLVQFSYNHETKKYDFSNISSNKDEFNFTENIIYSIERTEIDKYEVFGFYEKPELREFDFTDFKKYGFFQESGNGQGSVFVLCLKENSYTILKLDGELKLTEIYSVSGDKKRTSVFEDVAIDENGDIYFLERKYNNDSDKKYKKDEVDYYLNLHNFSSNSNNEVLKIDLDKNIVDVKILNNGSHFSLGGTFYTVNDLIIKKKFIGGMFRANIDKEAMALDAVHYIPFSLHLVKTKRGKGLQKRGGLYSPNLKSVFLYENGDMTLSVEEAYKTTNGNHTFSSNNDIFVMKVNAGGRLIWDRLVQKVQGTGLGVMDSKYFSYLSNLREDKCAFVFNSHKDVERVNSSEHIFKSSSLANSWAYLLEIDKAGNASHKTLNTNFDDVFVLNAKSAIIINENTFVAQGKLKGDLQLFKIRI